MAKNILVCDTTDCPNSGVEIVLESDATTFGCGPCGETISNVTVSDSADV
jgi:predicted RNA-binding Zn-ribbon protein involved in translation (DUF1610 family)